jgi:hypothetical protein
MRGGLGHAPSGAGVADADNRSSKKLCFCGTLKANYLRIVVDS